jgi:hypothetical protein
MEERIFSPAVFSPHNFATSGAISTIIFCTLLSQQGISLIYAAIFGAFSVAESIVSSSAAFWAVLHFTTLRLIYDV